MQQARRTKPNTTPRAIAVVFVLSSSFSSIGFSTSSLDGTSSSLSSPSTLISSSIGSSIVDDVVVVVVFVVVGVVVGDVVIIIGEKLHDKIGTCVE